MEEGVCAVREGYVVLVWVIFGLVVLVCIEW